MLTTNAIARWVGTHLDVGLIDLNVMVEDILSCRENFEEAAFVRRNSPAFAACDKLTGDRSPVALLVTQNGKPTETPLGILTVSDVPQMLRDIEVRKP